MDHSNYSVLSLSNNVMSVHLKQFDDIFGSQECSTNMFVKRHSIVLFGYKILEKYIFCKNFKEMIQSYWFCVFEICNVLLRRVVKTYFLNSIKNYDFHLYVVG